MKKFAIKDDIEGEEIRNFRLKEGMTQSECAELFHVSVKTIERWENSKSKITGSPVTLLSIFREYPQLIDNMRIPPKKYTMRLWYRCGDQLCTIIDVDERTRKVSVTNYTNQLVFRAFGSNEKPTYEEYEAFLESRCFPRSRDKIKLVLADLGLPFYDPLLIIEKTDGKMAEDHCWIQIER